MAEGCFSASTSSKMPSFSTPPDSAPELHLLIACTNLGLGWASLSLLMRLYGSNLEFRTAGSLQAGGMHSLNPDPILRPAYQARGLPMPPVSILHTLSFGFIAGHRLTSLRLCIAGQAAVQGAPDDAQGAAPVECHLVHHERLRPLARLRRRRPRQKRRPLLSMSIKISLNHHVISLCIANAQLMSASVEDGSVESGTWRFWRKHRTRMKF